MSKTQESRLAESRLATEREDLMSTEMDTFHVPEAVRKEGYVYKYVRMNVRGEEDFRLDAMLRQGWTLVPRDRYPAYAMTDPLRRHETLKDYIYNMDTILMERPALYRERALNDYYEKTRKSVNDLLGVEDDISQIYATGIRPIHNRASRI